MEKNVDLFAKRMKGAKSWSEEGASNLARIIALKMSGDFKYKIAALVSGRLSERFAECFEETITNTKGIIDKSIKNNI